VVSATHCHVRILGFLDRNTKDFLVNDLIMGTASEDKTWSNDERVIIWIEEEVLSWHFPGGSEEIQKRPQSGYPMFRSRFEQNTPRIQV
jgi:hypothetical protein